MEVPKAAPVTNSTKADSTSAAVPVTASLDDTEAKKVHEKNKRLQAEISKLNEEIRQLKVRCEDEILFALTCSFIE